MENNNWHKDGIALYEEEFAETSLTLFLNPSTKEKFFVVKFQEWQEKFEHYEEAFEFYIERSQEILFEMDGK